MNPIIKNILAIIAGWLVGSVINLSLVRTGHTLIPIEGIDPNNMDDLAAALPNLGFEYFIFPFLAHAIGTLSGAIIAGLIAVNHKMKFSLAIGGLFLLGGIMVNFMLPGPVWFTITDIVIAYIPMAWIGGKIAEKISMNNRLKL